MGKKKKGTGWKHPKTGVWWKSKRDYHRYWKQYLKPTKQKPETNLDDSEFEDFYQDTDYYFNAQENEIRNYYLYGRDDD